VGRHREVPAAPTPPPKPKHDFAMLCALAEQLRGSDVKEERHELPEHLDTPPVSPSSTGDRMSPPILEKVVEFPLIRINYGCKSKNLNRILIIFGGLTRMYLNEPK